MHVFGNKEREGYNTKAITVPDLWGFAIVAGDDVDFGALGRFHVKRRTILFGNCEKTPELFLDVEAI